MKSFLSYINEHVLHKAVRLNLANLSVKVIAGAIITKMIAVFIGAEGMALIGNLRNFSTALQALSIGGVYKGAVKYISKFKEDTLKLSEVISTTYYFGFFATLVFSFLCYFNAQSISNFLFPNGYQYAHIMRLMGLLLPFYSLNMFTFSIMNGFSKFKNLIIINIIGQILGLLVTIVLIWQDNIDGALISIVITPALVFLITLVGILWRRSLIGLIDFKNISADILFKMSPHMGIALMTSVLIPLVMILIRNYISSEIGLKEAGYWQAMNRISDYYLMFINSLMVLYVVPKLSTIKDTAAIKGEIFNFFKSVMPYLAGGFLLVYIFRNQVIYILLNEDFKDTADLFSWQLIGDLFKVMSMVIAFQFLAKKMFFHFIILQVFLFLILYFSSIYFVDVFGLRGSVMAHCLSYSMYFVIILLLFANSLFGVISNESES